MTFEPKKLEYLLKVQLPYEPSCPSDGQSIGRLMNGLAGRSVIIF